MSYRPVTCPQCGGPHTLSQCPRWFFNPTKEV